MIFTDLYTYLRPLIMRRRLERGYLWDCLSSTHRVSASFQIQFRAHWPGLVLIYELQLIAVGACGYLVTSATHAAVEFVEDAVVLVQVTELQATTY